MTDYSKGKCYYIKSNKTNRFYIGSTIQTLIDRFNSHKGGYASYKKNGTAEYCTSYDIIEYEDAYIELIEDYPCESEYALHRREGELQRNHLGLIVNKQIAGRTNKEWIEDNKEEVSKKSKEYRKNHKEERDIYNKQYQIDNKEILKKTRQEKREKEKKKKENSKTQEEKEEELKLALERKRISRKNKTERDKKARLNQTEEQKEQRRIRHNELQRIRRTDT